MESNFYNENIYLAVIIVLSFSLVVIKIKKYLKYRKNKRCFKRGIKLEKAAAKFLEKKGFEILGQQVPFVHTYYVNGIKTESDLIVDYFVKKNGKYFVIEVKSGNSAISIANKNTRRQILEYSIAIPCDGVYLLDMENRKLQKITFSIHHKSNFYVILMLLIIVILILFTFALK